MPPMLNLGTVLAVILAIGVSLILSPLPRQFPVLHWTNHLTLTSIGFIPALAPKPWAYTFEQLQSTDLTGQKALVTGANSGIGFEIASALSKQGASVTIACRNPQRCFAATDRIRKGDGYSGAPLSPLIMDVSDLKSVQKSAKTFLQHNDGQPLDMLFLNAGISHVELEKGATKLPTSKDGIETVFATNVVGHHLLYRLLEPVLNKSTMARVVSTASVAGLGWLPTGDASSLIPSTLEKLNEGAPSFNTYFILYGRSKLAQVAWSKALTRRLGDNSNIYVNAAHPGAVHTPLITPTFLPQFVSDIVVYLLSKLLWSAQEGALTEIYLGVATEDIRRNNVRGKYFHPQAVEVDHPYAKDEELQEIVWRLCEELVGSFL